MASAEKTIEFEGKKYKLDTSQKIATTGDFDEANNTVLIDKDIPEKFHEGIAIHEIHERNVLKKGHSYQFAHNEAQKRELKFYQKKYGKKEGEKMLREEEEAALKIASSGRRSIVMKKDTKKIQEEQSPDIITIFLRAVVYENKTYLIDNSNLLIGDVVDLYERKKIIYIDKNIPEWLFEGMALYVLEQRKMLKQGSSYAGAEEVASKKELAYFEKKLGSLEAAQKAIKGELVVESQKFAQEKKDLKDVERKIVNENVPK